MRKREVSLFGTPLLGGEAPDDRFGFKSGDGEESNGRRAIFPIIRVAFTGEIDLLGTGFFIATNGLLVTARHVIEAAFDRKSNQQRFGVSMVHFQDDGSYFIRPILRGAIHTVEDLAVGVAAPMTRNSDGAPLLNKKLNLNLDEVVVGSHVMTYAYPRYESRHTDEGQIFNLMPNFYDGEIVEHFASGRDRVMLPGPCYRTNMAIHHGASGGPVFSRDGMVFALNSTGYDGTEDSYVSSIGGILDLAIDDIAIGDQAPRRISIREIANAGHITVKQSLS
jgi:hypothetical protein